MRWNFRQLAKVMVKSGWIGLKAILEMLFTRNCIIINKIWRWWIGESYKYHLQCILRTHPGGCRPNGSVGYAFHSRLSISLPCSLRNTYVKLSYSSMIRYSLYPRWCVLNKSDSILTCNAATSASWSMLRRAVWRNFVRKPLFRPIAIRYRPGEKCHWRYAVAQNSSGL